MQKPSVKSLRKSRLSALLIVFWVLVAHIAAVAKFTRGFLLTRPVLPDFSNSSSVTHTAPFERAVVLIVDALRYDFVQPPENVKPGTFPFLHQFPVSEISANPQNAFVLKFMADPPTTTLQRLKGLTTGSLPAFVDAGSNFNGYAIEEDNWVSQARKHLGPVSFVGDDTWEALFSNELSQSFPFPSLNVRDLDTVDNGVKKYLPELISNSSNKIVIGHMLGVDHVGHRYGPSHPAMATKLRETFAFVQQIAEQIDEKTLLLVMGDHGMDPTGNHGGDSQDELEAALFAYSKRGLFYPHSESSKVVNQIDLVPTLSGLLGLPIPFNSLGFPIREAFGNKKLWNQIVSESIDQITRYAKAVGMPVDFAITSSEQFQSRMLEKFKDAWIQFDTNAMLFGIGLLVAAALLSIVIHNSSRAATLSSIAYFLNGGAIAGLLSWLALKSSVNHLGWIDRIISAAVYVASGSVLLGLSGTAVTLYRFDKPSKFTVLAVFVLGIEVATQFSNSWVIWESAITHYLLTTIYIILLASCAKQGSPLVMYLGGWCAFVALVVTRLSSCWHVCREETAQRCVTTFFEPNSSLVPLWTYFAIGIVGFVLPYYLKRFWAIGQNNVGLAPLILNMSSFAIMLTITYVSLDNAEAREWLGSEMRGLQTLKLLLGRFSMAVGLLGLFVWWNGSPPFEIVAGEKGHKIAGFNNIYGADVMLPVVCVFWIIAVTNKPPGILALAGLLYVSLSTLDFADITTTKYTLLVPVMFDLLGHSFFYYTGHQATIPSIQWDSAFVASSKVSYPWSPLTVFLNTMGPTIIATLSCVFCSLWRRPVFADCRLPMAFVVRSIMGLTLVTSVRTIASMAASFVLRRHLMTWKIFAPRYMFGAIQLLTADVVCLLAVVLAGHSIKKVTALFG